MSLRGNLWGGSSTLYITPHVKSAAKSDHMCRELVNHSIHERCREAAPRIDLEMCWLRVIALGDHDGLDFKRAAEFVQNDV